MCLQNHSTSSAVTCYSNKYPAHGLAMLSHSAFLYPGETNSLQSCLPFLSYKKRAESDTEFSARPGSRGHVGCAVESGAEGSVWIFSRVTRHAELLPVLL